MPEGNFNVGDVVQLKSGGPKMTIEAFDDFYGTQRAICVWFDKTERKSDNFVPSTLTAAY